MTMKDLPDWTRQVILRYEGGFIGLEELAARLGSIVPWDLKGNVVFMENFETALTEWIPFGAGGGVTIARSEEHKFSGSWSVKIVNSAVVGNRPYAYRRLHYPGLLKYGLFARFCINAYVQIISFYAEFYSGSWHNWFSLNYNLYSGVLEISTHQGTYTIASGVYLGYGSAFIWYPVLITFDLKNEVLDKLYFADKEYDLSSIPFAGDADNTYPCTYLDFGIEHVSGAARTAYFDDIILVKNVP